MSLEFNFLFSLFPVSGWRHASIPPFRYSAIPLFRHSAFSPGPVRKLPPSDNNSRWVCYHPQPASRFTFQETQGVKKFPTPPTTYHIEIVNSFRSHFDRLSPRDLTLTSMETVPTLDNSTSNSREEAILILDIAGADLGFRKGGFQNVRA